MSDSSKYFAFTRGFQLSAFQGVRNMLISKEYASLSSTEAVNDFLSVCLSTLFISPATNTNLDCNCRTTQQLSWLHTNRMYLSYPLWREARATEEAAILPSFLHKWQDRPICRDLCISRGTSADSKVNFSTDFNFSSTM